jgi:hypothetical protein
MSEELIILIAQMALKYGPAAAAAFVKIFQTKDPTSDQWDALWALMQKPL